jgi:hypothetical protein
MRERGSKKRPAAAVAALKSWGWIPKTVATDGNPVNYTGGRIYFEKGAFIAIRGFPNYGSDRKIFVDNFASAHQAWLHSLKAIDDYAP